MTTLYLNASSSIGISISSLLMNIADQSNNRDGVSEGEYQQIVDEEVPRIKGVTFDGI